MIKFIDTDITHRISSDCALSNDDIGAYIKDKYPDCKYWDITHHYQYDVNHWYTLNIFFEN